MLPESLMLAYFTLPNEWFQRLQYCKIQNLNITLSMWWNVWYLFSICTLISCINHSHHILCLGVPMFRASMLWASITSPMFTKKSTSYETVIGACNIKVCPHASGTYIRIAPMVPCSPSPLDSLQVAHPKSLTYSPQ